MGVQRDLRGEIEIPGAACEFQFASGSRFATGLNPWFSPPPYPSGPAAGAPARRRLEAGGHERRPSGFASLPDGVWMKGTIGLPPYDPPEGFHPSDSLPRFAAFKAK